MSPPGAKNSDSVSAMSLKERNYLGLSDCSSVGSSTVSNMCDENKINLNLKATELRLGLPGSESPERDHTNFHSAKLDEKPLFPLVSVKENVCSMSGVSGNKRGFSDTVEGNWMFSANDSESSKNLMLSSGLGGTKPVVAKDATSKVAQSKSTACGHNNKINGSDNNNAPIAKAQVVGWPPIRSFRKNTLVTKNEETVNGKPKPGGALFVKVSMAGAPYLRKVDLTNYSSYLQLSAALEKMFTGFTIGQCGSQLSETKLRDVLHGSEYVLTYEDKDGDWMLVGDVPWEMFTGSCKRLKIMKGSCAIGLAPRAMEKSKC